jgi:hypothetical protein
MNEYFSKDEQNYLSSLIDTFSTIKTVDEFKKAQANLKMDMIANINKKTSSIITKYKFNSLQNALSKAFEDTESKQSSNGRMVGGTSNNLVVRGMLKVWMYNANSFGIKKGSLITFFEAIFFIIFIDMFCTIMNTHDRQNITTTSLVKQNIPIQFVLNKLLHLNQIITRRLQQVVQQPTIANANVESTVIAEIFDEANAELVPSTSRVRIDEEENVINRLEQLNRQNSSFMNRASRMFRENMIVQNEIRALESTLNSLLQPVDLELIPISVQSITNDENVIINAIPITNESRNLVIRFSEYCIVSLQIMRQRLEVFQNDNRGGTKKRRYKKHYRRKSRKHYRRKRKSHTKF